MRELSDPMPGGVLTREARSGWPQVAAMPKVAILLCTHHGQHFLEEQLESFAAQTHPNWEVWASDDGSQDGTHAILEAYQKKWPTGQLSVHSGPQEGFAANFLSLVCKADIDADYYAFSDQDDVWEPNKLSRAIAALRTTPRGVPALYGSRTRLVDKNNRPIGLSPLFTKPPSFAHALVQNIAGGNTMVFNREARELICDVGPDVDVPFHDWWTYLLVSGCGGRVFYDPEPLVRYRQHDGNLFGENRSSTARVKRIRMLWEGHFRDWNGRNIQALNKQRPRLTPDNQRLLDRFAQARCGSSLLRLARLKRAGIYRQTFLGNLGLIAAALFAKI